MGFDRIRMKVDASRSVRRMAGVSPSRVPYSARGTGRPSPPSIDGMACSSILTKAPHCDASLSTRDAYPQQAGLADGSLLTWRSIADSTVIGMIERYWNQRDGLHQAL